MSAPTVSLEHALDAIGWSGAEPSTGLPTNWHGDQLWMTTAPDGVPAVVRAISLGRPTISEDELGLSTNTITRQVEVGEAFRRNGIPFMRLLAGPTRSGGRVVVAHEWVVGAALQCPDQQAAERVGRLLRQLHEFGADLDQRCLPQHDKRRMARDALTALTGTAPTDFLNHAREMVGVAETQAGRQVVCHGDLNNTNILWSDGLVTGVIDLDKIGVNDTLAELAWVVKWWSRPAGPGDQNNDRGLAAAVLRGYEADTADRVVIAALSWISVCLNLNGIRRIQSATADRGQLEQVVTDLRLRADRIAALTT